MNSETFSKLSNYTLAAGVVGIAGGLILIPLAGHHPGVAQYSNMLKYDAEFTFGCACLSAAAKLLGRYSQAQ